MTSTCTAEEAAAQAICLQRLPYQDEGLVQVEGCDKNLSHEKDYYRRYRICEEHLKLSSLLKDGEAQRFCQQCGRFHPLGDFDADKRYAAAAHLT